MAGEAWYRKPCRSEAERVDFEQRLARARSSRPEYLRLQAVALQEADEHELAIKVIDRLLKEHPDHFTAWLYERRADSQRALGHADLAMGDYMTSIVLSRRRPGARGDAHIELASLSYALGRTELYRACLENLEALWDPNPIFPRYELRQFGWAAVLLHALGETEAAQAAARRALAAAAKTRSGAAQHPSLGLATPDDQPLRDMLRQIVPDRAGKRATVARPATIARLRAAVSGWSLFRRR